MANALEAASLVMIPSGYEDGTLGSLKPTDGSGDFTFSRGSNLSATRINEQGYIEKGYENLLLQSNNFDTTWSKSSATLTSGQSGYDGSSDAWLLSKSGANGRIQQSLSTGGVSVLSIYAKANISNYIAIQFQSTFAYLDLTTGLAQNETSGIISATSTDEGNGWYRCSIVFNISASSTAYIYPAEDGSVSGTSGSIYIQDAMINQGLVAYPYIETTTAPVAGGILEDEPRIDFSDGCGHLLLEPSRTNVLPYSEYFNTYFGYGSPVITPNDIESPEGVINATKVQRGSSDTPIRVLNATTLGTQYTMSIWAKSGTATKIMLDIGDEHQATYDLTNEWQRFDISGTPNIYRHIDIQMPLSSSGDYFYIYGFQLEQDATYPTSYIPTYGVSQTRLEDSFDSNADFTNFFGDNQGTIYIETDKRLFENLSANEEFIGFKDGIKLWRIIGSQSIIFIQCSNWGSTILHYPSTTNPTKYLFKWDGSNVSFYIDGSLIGSGTQTAPFNPNEFGRTGNGVSMNSQELLNQFTLFPTALSDSECIALTTI